MDARREFLDQILFWNERDLKIKLDGYQEYFNEGRVHYSLKGVPPNQLAYKLKPAAIDPEKYGWKKYCGGLYSVPIAA